jgi:hypothetical protein
MLTPDEFDNEINLDYHNTYDNQSSIISNVIGGSVAAVGDFAASVWNSLPGTEEVATEDILRRISSNALRVYEENPDTIQTASFIGGLFVPSGLAFKGLQAARNGTKAVNWFSKAGRDADLAKVDSLFRDGNVATAAYRKARNELYAKGIANQALDAVAMEGAIVASMNAHPFMEDYMADPVKNFAIGAAFGGVLGAGIGRISDGFAIKNITGAAESSSFKTIFDELKTAYSSTQNATQVQIHEANIASLSRIKDGKETYDAFTREIAEKMLLNVRKDQAEIFESMLSPELKTLPSESKAELMKVFAQNPGMQGVENISYLTQKADGEASTIGMKAIKFSEKLNFAVKDIKDKAGNVVKQDFVEVMYLPEFGKYATPKDAKHYTRARDLGKTVEQLDNELGKDFGRIPNTSAAEELLSKNSAGIDGSYLAALNRIDKMTPEQVAKLAIAPDDLPMLNAVLSRMSKEPDAFEKIKLTVTRNQPNFNVVQNEVFKQGGVKSTHIDDLHKLTGDNPKFNMARDPSLSLNARNFIDDWISGSSNDKSYFRAAVDNHLRGGSVIDAKRGAAIEEIMNSPTRKAFLSELKKHADAEGNIYLWRGTNKGKAVGHSAVESYTTSHTVASRFGRPRLYKVAVDDVIGSITGDLREFEILVGSPARQVEASLPTSTLSQAFAKKADTVSTGTGMEELSNMLITQKEELINSMLKQGVPLETIAIRTNTPLPTVQGFATSAEGASLIEVGIFREYSNAADIPRYMDTQKRALNLSSNFNKKSYSDRKSGTDIQTMSAYDKELKEIWLKNSDSFGAQLVADRLLGQWKPALDLLRTQISNFVNTKAGNKFFQSTDFFTRDMGDAGVIASTIGKSIQDISNTIERRILEPIKGAMSSIMRDEVALIEANVAMNLNASLRGHRIYKDRQFWQMEKYIDEAGKEAERLAPVNFNNAEFIVKNDYVDTMLQEMQKHGRELYNMKNASNKILGKPDLNDIGFWVPSLNPKNKFIAYVHNQVDDTVKMLWSNTADELKTLVKSYEATIPAHRLNKEIKVILPDDKEAYNILNGRNDALTMEIADASMLKKGSTSSAIVKANADIFGELAGGYEHYIGSQTRYLADLAMSDITDALGRMSQVNQRWFKNQSLNAVGKMVSKPKDTANIIRNTLLGNSNLSDYTGWKSANQSFETGLSLGVKTVSSVFDAVTAPFRKGLIGGKKPLSEEVLAKADYKEISEKLEKAGVVNPWATFDNEAAKMFGLAKLTDSKDSSARLVYASNAFAATVALRVGEIAQPLVNAMSLPILTSLAIANKMPETFMGIQKGTAKVGAVEIMMGGVRSANDPAYKHLGKMWEDMGYFKPMVSEANETLALSRGFDPTAITKVEKALDSNLVKILSKPADWSEAMVRRQTMYTGAYLAKSLYPELDDIGITIFARDFMDRAVGNYHAAQRPVLFQGTAGVALGLFQTYMVTMAQNIYRGIELKNYKGLAKAMMAQSTIFGTSSLPGFHLVSEKIGEHFSDNNVDLTTGTYRALNDKLADFILYGLPSNLGPAFYTRGELNPRFPGGVTDIVGINFAMQAGDMVKHVASSLGSDYPDIAQSMGEALSMQSISRPLARTAELFTGHSVTRAGNTVSTPEEVWTAIGVLSRLMSTRPMAEAKLRQADHLNSHYGALDREARQELMMEIRTALRNGTLSDELVARVSHDYTRKGGTPTGWRNAYRTALNTTNVNGKANLVSKLDEESPINFMIDNL